jgi:hypothetical protein
MPEIRDWQWAGGGKARKADTSALSYENMTKQKIIAKSWQGFTDRLL